MSAITLGAGTTSDNSIVEDDAGSYSFSRSFAFGDLGAGISGTDSDFHNLAQITGVGSPRGTLTAIISDEALGNGDSTGSVTWSYAVSNALLQDLAAGQQIVETFNITILDSEGHSLLVPITVTITGTNDAPIFTASEAAPVVTLAEDSAATLSSMGTLTFNDVDTLDTHSISNVSVVASGTTSAALTDSVLKAMLSTPVTSTTTAAGGSLDWSFSAANTNFDYLDSGETLTLTYTVTLSDGHGGTALKNITVNVTGTNDVATIAVTNVSDTEADTSTVVSDSIGSHVTITDLDASDAALPTEYVAGSGLLSSTTTGPGVPPLITFNPVTGAFSYNKANFNYLAAGETVTYTFSFNAKSGNDAVQPQTLTLTLTGQNDAPTLAVVAPLSDVSLPEPLSGPTNLIQTGAFIVTDVDVSNTLSISEGSPSIVWSKVGETVPAGVVTALTTGAAFSIVDTDLFPNDNHATVAWTLASSADFNFLAVGETLTITYPVIITDGTTPITRNIVVTMTGANDAPVVTGAVLGSATEDGASVTVNALGSASDVDLSDTLSVTSVPAILPDGVTYNSATHSFALDPGNAAYQHLAAGAQVTFSIGYLVSDGLLTTPASVQFTVTGTNDAPVVSGAVTGNATEDGGTVTLNALLNASDVDDLASLSVTNVPATLPDGVTYNALLHTFTLNPSDAAYQHLAVGETQVVTVSYGVFDGAATTPASVSFTVTGTNDTPVAMADTGGATEGVTLTVAAAQGVLANDTDADTTDILTVTEINGLAGGVGSSVAGSNGGSFTVAATGGYTFAPGAAFENLSVGTIRTTSVDYTVSDGHGGTATQTLTVTVTGTNDAPVITSGGVITGSVTDPLGTGDTMTHYPASGSFAFTDIDLDSGGVETPTVSTISFSSSLAGATAAQTAALALLESKFTAVATPSGSNGTVNWSFNPTGADIDFLRAGQTATLVFNVVVNDGSGPGNATVTQPVTITITGTNDLVVDGATVETQAGTLGAPLLLAVAEVNGPDTATVTASGIFDFVDGDLTGNVIQVSSVAGGTLTTQGTLTAVAGTPTPSGHRDVTYTYTNTQGALDYLADGQIATAKFLVRVLDQDAGGFLDKYITVTATGTNDAPVITTAAVASNQTEIAGVTGGAGTLSATGSLAFTDVDTIQTGEVATFSVTSSGTTAGLALNNAQLAGLLNVTATATGTTGTTGSIGYSWSAADSAFDYLGDGDTLTLTYLVTITDSSGATGTKTVTINIAGSNDQPVVTVGGGDSVSLALTETNAGLTGTGTLSVSDVDLTDLVTASVNVVTVNASSTGTDGGLSNAALKAFLSIASHTDLTSAVTGNGALTWNFNSGSQAFNYLAAGKTLVLDYVIRVADDAGGFADKTVTVTITGTNDAPVVTGAVLGAATEDGASVTVDALANATDVDVGNTLTVTNVPGALPAGVTYNTLTHSFTLDPTNAAYQHLKSGATQVVSVTYDVSDATTTTAAAVSFTVTGTNDAPVVTGAVTGAATEDGATVTLNALLNASDVDDMALLSVVNVPGTLPAGVTYTPGTHSFTLDPTNPAYQNLAAAETRVVTVNYGVSDGTVTTPHSVSFTVTGTNDAPVAVGGGDSTETFAEVTTGTQTLATSGSFVFHDADDIDILTATPGATTAVWSAGTIESGLKAALEGALLATPVFNAATNDTTVSWSYSAAAVDLNFLGAGETITVTKTISVSDGAASVSRDIVITITGSNDAPTILSTVGGVSASQGEAATGTQTVVGTGSFTSTDVDANDVLTTTSSAAAAAWSGGTIASLSAADQATIASLQAAANLALTDTYNATTNTLTTGWSFSKAGADLNFLSGLETLTLTYIVTVSDGHGGTVPQTLTITINGAAEVFTGTAASDLTLNGSDYADVIDGLGGDDRIDGLDGNDIITGGTGDDTIKGGAGTDTAIYSGSWKDYAISQAVGGAFTISDLRSGAPDGIDIVSGVESFQFFNGTFTAAQILNDAPTVATALTAQNATEDSPFSFVVGTNTFADADSPLGDTLTYTATLANGAALPSWLTFNPATRTFSGTPLNGDVGAVSLKVVATDLAGATVASAFTLTVANTNDAPVVSGAVTGAATEDGAAVTLDALANASDVDVGNLLSVVNVPASLPAGVTYSAATHAFTLDPLNAAYQHLAAGATQTVTVNYGVSDGAATTPTSVTFTITGTNDAPVVSGAVTGAANEDGATVTLDALANATDADDTPTLTVTSVPASLPAGVTYSAATHSFTLDPTNAAYQSLAAGATQTVTVNYGVSDGTATTAASVSFTVTGTNDAPVVSGAVTGSATEDGAAVTLDALLNASDVDVGNVLSVVNVPASLPAGVTYSAATHAFTLDPLNAAYQHLAAGATQTVTVNYGVSDGTATTPTSVTFTITGTNDAPVVSGAVTGSATEDGASVTLDALANASDPDDLPTLTVTNVPGTLPSGVTYSAATHSFTLDPANAAYQDLAAGATRVVIVSYGVFDGTATTSASVSFTVTGSNTAPTVSGAVTGAATENGASVTLDALLNASDIDAGAVLSVTGVPGTLPAGVTYSAATHAFTLDPGNAAYQHLAAGATQTVTVNYGVSDGTATTAASVSFTITGTNNGPVVTAAGDTALTPIEIAENTTAVVTLTATDADLPAQTLAWSIATPAAGYDNGLFAVDATTGALSFIAAPDFEGAHIPDYKVAVQVFDGLVTTTRDVFIRVTDVSPVITTATNGIFDGTSENDTIIGLGSNDALYGRDGNDKLYGGLGNDLLSGGAGNDAMYGGAGNDSYIVDTLLDTVTEAPGAAGGIDNVTSATISLNLANYANVERVVLTGALALSATGNSGGNILYGSSNSAANSLTGLAGDDLYFVGAGDVIHEAAGAAGGNDTVSSDLISLNLNLASYANVENVTLTGAANLNATGSATNNLLLGNSGANILSGLAGNDLIYGGLGNDTLTGGAGSDNFVFNTALNGVTNKDTITDFIAADDTIRLENTGPGLYTALTAGTLTAAAFYAAAGAVKGHDATDRIVYNTTTGDLYYDADGSGAGVATKFATLTAHPTITNADFYII